MKKIHNEFLGEWERATENFAQYFSARYFGNGADCYWVADEIGGVFYSNDHFFSINDMVDFVRYNYTKDEMSEYYDYALKCAEKNENPINIKNYKKLQANKK